MITTTELKQYLNITDSTLDSFLSNVITHCTAKIEAEICTSLSSSSRTRYFNGNSMTLYLINDLNVTALTSLRYREDPTDSWTTISPSLYGIHNVGLLHYVYFSDVFDSSYTYELVYTAGYSTIPTDLKTLCIELSASWFNDSEHGKGRLGLNSQSITIHGQVGTNSFHNVWETRVKPELQKYRVFVLA